MRETRIIMGMPVVIEVVGAKGNEPLERVFEYFTYVDEKFSTYKRDSEISRINRGELQEHEHSDDVREIFRLAEETKRLTNGFFDIRTPHGSIDPSGLVKGWAILNTAKLLHSLGYENYYVEVAGDIQTSGVNAQGQPWRIGVRNPFKRDEIVKVLYPRGAGIVTSGTYIRGAHIYDPHAHAAVETPVKSLTVIGPDVYEADRFATAAYAMGTQGLEFIEGLGGFEGYEIQENGMARMTSGFEKYIYDEKN